MKNRIPYGKVVLILGCLFIGAVLLVVVFSLIENALDEAENDISALHTDSINGQILYESNWYIPKDSLESILILGIDKMVSGPEERKNSEQADFLALVVLDKDKETYKIIYINRDTITDIPQTDAFGEVYGYIKGQLALAHTYGNDEKTKCRNTENTVEKLLYGINIDHYLSMTMDAVAVLNDSVGGVTVQLMDDFTELDETFLKNTVVTLKGEQALTYVQARVSLEDSSNLHRMDRQKQYISALLEKLSSYEIENDSDALIEVSEYLVSDCTIEQLSRMLERIGNYTCEETISIEGEAVKGNEFIEFYADEQALQELVIETFYEKKD